jgi:hypothetical protein
MKDADYRQKTANVSAQRKELDEQRRQMEQIYGPFGQQQAPNMMGVQQAHQGMPQVQQTQTDDPYGEGPTVQQQVTSAMDQYFAVRDQRSQQASIEQAKNADWQALCTQHPDLLDANSDLKQIAEQAYAADPFLANTPLGQRYAVQRAMQILGPAYQAQARAEGARQVVNQLGNTAPVVQAPAGGGTSTSDDNDMTAQETNLLRYVNQNPGVITQLSDKQMKAYRRASVKFERLGRE